MTENIIQICMGSSCFSRGNNENLEAIKEYIKIHNLDTNVVLTGNLCIGSCNSGPNISFNDSKYSNVTPAKIEQVLDQMFMESQNVKS